MNKNSLAQAYAAALRPQTAEAPLQQTAGVAQPAHAATATTAASAVLLAAVRRSLESCRDPSQLRMLQAFAPAARA